MRVRIDQPESRFPSPWELYSLIVLIGAAIYIPASYFISWFPPLHSPLRYSGIACPLCGGTRAVTALVTGQVVLALKYNPLAVAVFLAFLFAMFNFFVLVVPFRKRIVFVLTTWQITLLWVLVGLAFAANWAYVLWAGMYDQPLPNPF
ncbi:MAG: DUF2752 domain-containing protein [Planctomycetes bacterium]|nr:DUF2752 domain-containing protein [Planctomycetota bacterium]